MSEPRERRGPRAHPVHRRTSPSDSPGSLRKRRHAGLQTLGVCAAREVLVKARRRPRRTVPMGTRTARARAPSRGVASARGRHSVATSAGAHSWRRFARLEGQRRPPRAARRGRSRTSPREAAQRRRPRAPRAGTLRTPSEDKHVGGLTEALRVGPRAEEAHAVAATPSSRAQIAETLAVAGSDHPELEHACREWLDARASPSIATTASPCDPSLHRQRADDHGLVGTFCSARTNVRTSSSGRKRRTCRRRSASRSPRAPGSASRAPTPIPFETAARARIRAGR